MPYLQLKYFSIKKWKKLKFEISLQIIHFEKWNQLKNLFKTIKNKCYHKNSYDIKCCAREFIMSDAFFQQKFFELNPQYFQWHDIMFEISQLLKLFGYFNAGGRHYHYNIFKIFFSYLRINLAEARCIIFYDYFAIIEHLNCILCDIM